MTLTEKLEKLAERLELQPYFGLDADTVREAITSISDAKSFSLTERNADTLDAERYRYLRNIAGQIKEDDDGPMVCDGMGDNFEFLRGVEVDASLDAAMALWKAAGCPLPKEAA